MEYLIRRSFLKATAGGLAHPATLVAIGPALVRQGNRRLKDITADELMQLLAWAGIETEDLVTLEDIKRRRATPIASLHPQYYFEHTEGKPGTDVRDRIWFRYWWWDQADEDWGGDEEEVDGCIEIGAVWSRDGYAITSPTKLVRWFLDRGFKVW
jgi:hypothetical protein